MGSDLYSEDICLIGVAAFQDYCKEQISGQSYYPSQQKEDTKPQDSSEKAKLGSIHLYCKTETELLLLTPGKTGTGLPGAGHEKRELPRWGGEMEADGEERWRLISPTQGPQNRMRRGNPT
ncbi:hypothetical protein MRB53_011089 [Persea americana]|uniref:Uncharacterized protein n=1 Tax=Persea americana TaxID=3435 RepID=A0ACC2LTM8_PERAE|nr:hypothetical protein MRB53_011089 [Persea americana]